MEEKERRSQLKQKRIMTYFIEAAEVIIKKEGIDNVTIRNVADQAGYTSATLYNYFDKLSHLVFLANMHYLEEYNNNLAECIKDCKNSIEVYMAVCKCFSFYAFDKPEIFELLFFSHGNEVFEKYTKQYYELYPENDCAKAPKFLDKIFHLNNLYSRSYVMLENCINDGFIEKENAVDFNDISLRFYKTILADVKAGHLEKDAAMQMTLRYYNQLFGFYLKSEYKYLLEEYYSELILDK